MPAQAETPSRAEDSTTFIVHPDGVMTVAKVSTERGRLRRSFTNHRIPLAPAVPGPVCKHCVHHLRSKKTDFTFICVRWGQKNYIQAFIRWCYVLTLRNRTDSWKWWVSAKLVFIRPSQSMLGDSANHDRKAFLAWIRFNRCRHLLGYNSF